MVLLLLFVFTYAHGEIILKSHYCINEPYLSLQDLDKNTNEKLVLLSIPKNSVHYKVPSIKILTILKEKGFNASDQSGGVIEFIRNCYDDNAFKYLHVKIEEKFMKNYPHIQIDSLKITPSSTLPLDFEELILKDIVMSSLKLYKKNGTFLAHFTDKENVQKSYYFKFNIKAKVPVCKAKYNIIKGKVLDLNDCENELMPLENLPQQPIFKIKKNQWIAKFYIKKDTILTKNNLTQKPTIQKGSTIVGIIQDGALSLQIDAYALKDGNVGDVIRIKAHNGKVYKGIIQDEKRVLIQ